MEKDPVNLSYYYIDYDNKRDLEDDSYHVFYGQEEGEALIDFVCSFQHEEDAQEYVEWKNENELIYEVDTLPEEDMTDIEKWEE